jgi:hypothetical protein
MQMRVDARRAERQYERLEDDGAKGKPSKDLHVSEENFQPLLTICSKRECSHGSGISASASSECNVALH